MINGDVVVSMALRQRRIDCVATVDVMTNVVIVCLHMVGAMDEIVIVL
jgi:hypothetical protein